MFLVQRSSFIGTVKAFSRIRESCHVSVFHLKATSRMEGSNETKVIIIFDSGFKGGQGPLASTKYANNYAGHMQLVIHMRYAKLRGWVLLSGLHGMHGVRKQ